jgi:rRNA biogenesis protein RRP5
MEVDVKQRVALTFLPNLVDWAPFQYPEDIQIGKVVNDASIVRTDGSLGVLLSIQEGALLAFTHISRVSDERVENLDPKKYRVGSTHRCRIVSFDPLDGIVQASMEQSVIDAKFFRYEDVQVGQVISDARVIRLDATTGNLLMSLSPSTDIRARCLPSHFADVPKISNPEKRFKQNDKLKVRVLSVDAPNRRVLVTHKKTLVTSKLPFLLSIEEAANILKDAGELWTHGVVTGTKPYGIFVTCGHRVKGACSLCETVTYCRTDSYQRN